jgi:hypothetical protein
LQSLITPLAAALPLAVAKKKKIKPTTTELNIMMKLRLSAADISWRTTTYYSAVISFILIVPLDMLHSGFTCANFVVVAAG